MIKGQHMTDQARANISAGLKGHKTSPETKAKLAAALRGRKYSAETLKKMSLAKIGRKISWQTGRRKDYYGYIYIYSPNHPHCTSQGYVLEHRLLMEEYLGRPLLPTEVVHHINGIRDDNRIENLMRFDSSADHSTWHQEQKRKG